MLPCRAQLVRGSSDRFDVVADGDITPKGYKLLVKKMEVLSQLEAIRLKVRAKASAQRLADGIERLVVKSLFALI